MPGTTISSGMRILTKPAKITPMRASHSLRAPRQRWTMNWLVQLYQMPTEISKLKTPNQGQSLSVIG